MLKQAIGAPYLIWLSQAADALQRIPAEARHAAHKLLWPVPERLRRRQIHPGTAALHAVAASCRTNFYKGWRSEAKYSREAFKRELNDNVWQRLNSDREKVVPWIDAAMPLEGKRVLEIGCGTGSSTVALAEQGALVTGVDIDEDALIVARDRAEAYGVEARFLSLNAQSLNSTFRQGEFDLVIFFACLEHMTLPERLGALREAWQLLPAKGLLAVAETPNRLWYFDDHTSHLSFYHWLPDELAFHYSRFSPRQNFREMYRTYDAQSEQHFLRRGRGMSFHEFELALERPARELGVVSSLSSFRGLRHSLRQPGTDRAYKALLRRIFPGVHEGFFDSDLYLILEKR